MPAAVGAFSLLMIFGNDVHPAGHLGAPDTNLFFASVTMTGVLPGTSESPSVFQLSNGDLNLEKNVWREAIFASTNTPQSPSSKRSLSAEKTNRLTL
ncbi:MAG: hypothetical protein ABI042_01820 [Verrucomicrobiota bacterium]